MSAQLPGKLKTLCQNVAAGFLLFPAGTLTLPNHQIGLFLLYVATALTLWSGWGYFAAFFGGQVEEPASPKVQGEGS
jgi:phosphatidylglycerophosphate synthase